MPVIGSGGGPNIAGRKEQKKPAEKRHPSQIGGPGNRSAVKRGTSRDILSKMPPTIVEDFNRRVAEVEFAKESRNWSGNLNGAYKKYGHLISMRRLRDIYNNPNEYIKQLGIGANPSIKNQQGLASIKGFEKYVRRTLNEAGEKTKQLNKHLFPGGHDRSNIVRSIHFGHGQGLMAAGANIGGSYTAQMPLDNMGQGKQSGPSKGAIGSDGWYKVDDAYSAIDHPQFWDEAWSNYILGEDMPILVDLTDDAKNKVLHKGYNPDRVIIEQDNINLNRIDDGVAESIPFRRKGPPPKGEILTVDGRPLDPIQPTPQVTELGSRLGGIGTRLNVGGNLRRTDNLAQLGIAASQGDVVGTAISGTQLAAGEALQTRAVQAKLAKQVAKLAAQRGGKTALKLAPGVGLAISGAEAYGYAKQGSWDQAAVAALSGVVGELPGFGDAASAALDLWNTSQDISDLHKAAQQEAQLLKQGYNAD